MAKLKGATIQEIEISISSQKNPPDISSQCKAIDFFRKIWDAQLINIQEQVYVLFLNNANKLIGWRLISTGTTTSTMVDVKLIVAIACKTLATGIILAHNHPSGNLKPSNADIEITNKIKDALSLFDIRLHDHVILNSRSYFSFYNNCLLITEQKKGSHLNERKKKANLKVRKEESVKAENTLLSVIQSQHEVIDFQAKRIKELEAKQ